MQYVAIKREEKNGTLYFVVNAIPLKNKNKSVVQKIPHPLGSDVLMYKTLEEAKDAVLRAGFSYVLPNGEKGEKKAVLSADKSNSLSDYDTAIYSAIKNKVNSDNLNVSAAAIMALAEFPREETFDILFSKIAEDNDTVRKNAISAICRYGNLLQDRIIETLKSQNWVVRNSGLNCISMLSEMDNFNAEKFLTPLIAICDDSNTIVQASALTVLAKVYQCYQKQK